MSVDVTRSAIQKQAVNAWIKAKGIGTMQVATGVGKNFIAIGCAKRVESVVHGVNGKLKIIHLAETTIRENDFKKEIDKYNDLFGFDLNAHADIEYRCYQGAYKLQDQNYDMVIADEIHNSITDVYSQFFESNNYRFIVGLSATIDNKDILDGLGTTKYKYLQKFCPIVYSYTLNLAQIQGTARKVNVHIINAELDTSQRYYDVRRRKTDPPLLMTEKDAYVELEDRFKKARYIGGMAVTIASRKRSAVLYKSKQKIEDCKKLLAALGDTPTILFGNDIDSIAQITETVSSRHSKKKNAKIIEEFNSGERTSIGSFKMLKQGINLDQLDAVIMHSYYSKSLDFIQRLGRLRKRKDGKEGMLFVFVTKGTQEVSWFSKMFEGTDSFNKSYYKNVDECIAKLNLNSNAKP